MELKDLLNKQLPQMPTEIVELLRKNEITGTPFECKNHILSNEILQKEVGYKKLADGTYLVSITWATRRDISSAWSPRAFRANSGQ